MKAKTPAVWGLLGAGLLFLALLPALAQDQPGQEQEQDNPRTTLEEARRQAMRARERVAAFEHEAKTASAAADKATLEAAALAARVQQAEAATAAAEAQLAVIARQRRLLDHKLAKQRQPLAELTAALQSLARRPAVLGLLRPATLRDTVHLNAILAGTIPRIDAQTAILRADLQEAQRLEQASRQAAAQRRTALAALAARRSELSALAAGARLAAQRATGSADREAVRAYTLAEKARDLGTLMAQLEQEGSLRERLAALPGPLLRPSDPARAPSTPARNGPSLVRTGAPQPYRLPVYGHIASGFGEVAPDGLRKQGLTLVPRGHAQVIAPAAGRIAFAGPYRGFGKIVIVEHPGGWMSLVTGLETIQAAVGQQVVAGSPLGLAADAEPSITVELRHQGRPVNPLQYVR